MKRSQLFPSKYLKADDCADADLVLTISDIKSEEIGMPGQTEEKRVLYFDEVEKGLVLNQTNWATIETVTGQSDDDDWIGHKIALYAVEVNFQGKVSLGIRVRLKKPAAIAKPVRPPSTSASDLQTVKRQAWSALKLKYATVADDAELQKILAGHIGEFFEGQTTATIGVKQWQQMIDAGFDADRLAMAGEDLSDALKDCPI